MSQAVPTPRLDLTALDERVVPSTVTAVTTARPFDFVGTGTLTTQTGSTAGGTALTNSGTANVTLRGVIDYAGNTGGQSPVVTFTGVGTGTEGPADPAATGGIGDYAQTVQGGFGFKDDNGTVTATDPLTGVSKWVTGTGAGSVGLGPQSPAGSFDVSTFKLQTAWGDPAAAGTAGGTLAATLASKTPAATDVAFGETTATAAADGSLGLQFTVKMAGDLVKAPTRDTAVARVTATWEGGGKSEAVELDVPVYWNTGSVAVKVEDLDPPEWAETLTVRLDADGKLAEGDEANNTWAVTLADVAPPPVAEPPASPPPPAAP
ncbi:MAG: hypothetical protein K2X82_17440, partial [Gemmataceae bacterium]|nr:hypothetical protein [Gemmataceae bacterium]